mmetsp:Transcript_16247/g.28820  ORF Transcript_16247/g.28820 Transcript_16247/m.28820 type:complete len:250 (+) Transcript_16247:686-1435(+)
MYFGWLTQAMTANPASWAVCTRWRVAWSQRTCTSSAWTALLLTTKLGSKLSKRAAVRTLWSACLAWTSRSSLKELQVAVSRSPNCTRSRTVGSAVFDPFSSQVGLRPVALQSSRTPRSEGIPFEAITRAVGQTSSDPLIRNLNEATCDQVRSSMRSLWASRVGTDMFVSISPCSPPWYTTGTPSFVIHTSNSTLSAPVLAHSQMLLRVFSGSRYIAPRCPTTRGRVMQGQACTSATTMGTGRQSRREKN